MIVIRFEDFRRFAVDNNKRVYYYQTGNILEVYTISDGIFVKSFIDTTTIENREVFFGDKLFFGATQLLFRLVEGGDNTIDAKDMKAPPALIEQYVPEEADGGEDIQRTGVE